MRSIFRKFGCKEETTPLSEHGSNYAEIELSPLNTKRLEDGFASGVYGSSQRQSMGAARPDDQPISAWQAAWNVTVVIQGMFIVSFPYAVVQGGYWAIIAMVVVAYICCHTGKILVDCLYEEDSSGALVRVRDSYVAIAEEVWGRRIGGRIVNCAQLIELLMTCILYVLLCGDLIVGSFPNTPVDLTSWIMICTAPLLACAFLKSLRRVSWLSFWCTVTIMVLNTVILVYCLTKAQQFKWGEMHAQVDVWAFPTSMGIILFSYTSQIFLPALEEKMEDRSKFNSVMNWTHAVAGIVKSLVAAVGFLTWGLATQEVITNNLPGETLRPVLNMILLVNVLLAYPLPYFAAVELLQATFFEDKPRTAVPSCFDDGDGGLKPWALALRIGVVLLTMVLAIVVPQFALLTALIGSLTGSLLSFVCPCYFHIRLKWHLITWYAKVLDILIIILGLTIGTMGACYSSINLYKSTHHPHSIIRGNIR